MRAKSTEKFANANINERSKMTINERMFTLIKDNNYKKADLARMLNINTSVIATWEKRGTNKIKKKYNNTGGKKLCITITLD